MSNPSPISKNNPTGSPGSAPADLGALIQFSLGAMAIATGLSIAAAHAPDRIRLFGLFSIGFGLLIGWLVMQLATMLQVRLTPSRLVLIGAVTFAGLVGVACQTVALQPAQPPALPHPVAAILAAKMQEESGIKPGEAIPEITPMSAAAPGFGIRVQRYLHRRVQTLGNWSTPWPELFWAGELLAGTAGAVGIAMRLRRREPQA